MIDIIAPVKIVLYNARLVKIALCSLDAPDALAGYGFCVRIQQIFFRIEYKAVFRVEWTVYAVGVFEFLNVELEYDHGIDVADSIIVREF